MLGLLPAYIFVYVSSPGPEGNLVFLKSAWILGSILTESCYAVGLRADGSIRQEVDCATPTYSDVHAIPPELDST